MGVDVAHTVRVGACIVRVGAYTVHVGTYTVRLGPCTLRAGAYTVCVGAYKNTSHCLVHEDTRVHPLYALSTTGHHSRHQSLPTVSQ